MFIHHLKSTARNILSYGYFATGHFLRRLQGKVVILMYHRVLSEKELKEQFVQPGMYVRDDVFEKQTQFLKEHFQILSFTELLNLWRGNKWDETKRYCVITFDDGWLDNYIYAYPILKKNNIPATIFLPTAIIDTNQWFWPEKISYMLYHYFNNGASKPMEPIPLFYNEGLGEIAKSNKSIEDKIDLVIEKYKESSDEEIEDTIKKMSRELNIKIPDERMLLNWNEVKEMSQNNISFGSHSCDHKILTKLSIKEIEKELEDSFHTLQEEKINYTPVFCYPNGNYNSEIQSLVKNCGYQAAVSTRFGLENSSAQDLFSLKRIGIHNDITSTMSLFALRILALNQ